VKTLTEEQQQLFDTETSGLLQRYVNVSYEFIESLGFRLVRVHSLQNQKGDEAELEVFENDEGKRIVKLCVTQFTHSEGDLLHISCYADEAVLPLLEQEANRYRNGSIY